MPGDREPIDDPSLPPDALQGLSEAQVERLTALLDEYLSRLENGEQLPLETILRQHDDLREPLKLYLGKLSELHNFAAGFSPHLTSDTDHQLDDSLGSYAPAVSVDASRNNPGQTGADWLDNARLDSGNLSVQALQDKSTERNRQAGADAHCETMADLVQDGFGAATQDPAAQHGGSEDGAAKDPMVARRLGDFELIRLLGRGGMGIVYEARQLSLRRRVALKLLPLISVLDARQITRFKNEAQAAASLQHPNIVPVYAVGHYQGIHYYAMRLIDGHPLDAIIAALRQRARPELTSDKTASAADAADDALHPTDAPASEADRGWSWPTEMRRVVQLGIQTASALAAAHEEGIIHRDIKPSNLIVDLQGKVWITDFGLARRTTDHSLTATGDVMGTLRYMSPEQAAGRTALVDGRADIYSLGATLYELLALEPAIVGENSPALLRAIEQQVPKSLRAHRPDLPRDLVTVIETAMAKNRDERYLTAQQMADDLTRVLEGRPTLAKPPSLFVRAAKWTLRHQRTAKIASVAFLFAAACLSIGLWIIVNSELQASRDRKKLQQSLQQCYAEMIPELKVVPGAEQARHKLLRRLIENYRSFVNDSRKNKLARANLAMGLMHLGDLYREQNDAYAARLALMEARQLLKSMVGSSPNAVEYRRQLGNCCDLLGRVHSSQGEMSAAEGFAREAIEVAAALCESHPGSIIFLADLARSTNHLSLLLAETDRRQEATDLLKQISSRLETELDRSPDAIELRQPLGATYNNLSNLLGQSDPEAAVRSYEQSLLVQAELAKDSDLPAPSAELAITYSNLGKARARIGQVEKACEDYQRAIAIQTLLVGIAPNNYSYRRSLSVSLNNLASAEARLKRFDLAQQHFLEAIQAQRALLEQQPSDAAIAHELGGTYNNLATLLEGAGDSTQTDAAFDEAVRYQSMAHEAAPEVPTYREFLDNHLFNYAAWLRRTSRDSAAIGRMLQRRELWRDEPEKLVELAKELAEIAIKSATSDRSSGVASAYADAARDTLRLVEEAGHGVQSVVSQEPFVSLAKLKMLKESARP